MKKATAILFIVLGFVSGTANAQQKLADPQLKSPTTATNAALLGFAVPIAMVVAGAAASGGESDGAGLILMGLAGSIFGPGLGHSYAGDSGRFWRGAGLRTLAYSGVAVAIAVSWDDTDNSGAGALAIGMVVLYLYSSIHDIATASASAERYNERHKSPEVTLTPLWVPQERAVGLGFAGTF